MLHTIQDFSIQDINLELIRRASFNEFDGEKVVNALNANKELWESAYMTRFDLIPLRDMSNNSWNIDTLYILAKKGQTAKLISLAKQWSADEVDLLPALEANHLLGGGGAKDVIRVWWD